MYVVGYDNRCRPQFDPQIRLPTAHMAQDKQRITCAQRIGVFSHHGNTTPLTLTTVRPTTLRWELPHVPAPVAVRHRLDATRIEDARRWRGRATSRLYIYTPRKVSSCQSKRLHNSGQSHIGWIDGYKNLHFRLIVGCLCSTETIVRRCGNWTNDMS